MFDLFGSVKHLTKISKLCIDNNVFRIHYKATVIMLVAFSLVVTSKQYIGDPIDCIVDEIPPHVMDTYCWIYSTFTVTDKLTGKVGKDIAHPGVGSHIEEEGDIKYHKYYQWVCFVLIFQSILFYMPHYLWKSWENGRIKSLMLNLNDPIVDEDTKNGRVQAITQYFIHNSKSHDLFFLKYLFCELLTLVNVIGQFFFLNFFLDGEFISYGHLVAQYKGGDPEDRAENPMAKVFPKVTKCTFHKFGPSGSVQRFDGLCVLPVNILNEKIYAIIWFWFVILIILTSIVVFYRILVVASSCTRVLALTFGNGRVVKSQAQTVVTRTNIGDWFMLNQLRKNMEPQVFGEIITSLSQKI